MQRDDKLGDNPLGRVLKGWQRSYERSLDRLEQISRSNNIKKDRLLKGVSAL